MNQHSEPPGPLPNEIFHNHWHRKLGRSKFTKLSLLLFTADKGIHVVLAPKAKQKGMAQETHTVVFVPTSNAEILAPNQPFVNHLSPDNGSKRT
jgi:hypothetical protein